MSSPQVDAYIALGGNMGDVLATFRQAVRGLGAGGAEVFGLSPAYRTRALLRPGSQETAEDYFNAVCGVRTRLSPTALLGLCAALEDAAGRVRGPRWAPRPLDLDLLVFGPLVLQTAHLSLPHPELAKRVFVLRPLVDLAPDLPIPPDGVTASQLLQRHPDPEDGIFGRHESWFLQVGDRG